MIGWFMSQNIPMGGGTNLKSVPIEIEFEMPDAAGYKIDESDRLKVGISSIKFNIPNNVITVENPFILNDSGKLYSSATSTRFSYITTFNSNLLIPKSVNDTVDVNFTLMYDATKFTKTTTPLYLSLNYIDNTGLILSKTKIEPGKTQYNITCSDTINFSENTSHIISLSISRY